ncbi:hypothetical protein C8J57DRAFT_1525039 [Mycena rebaudengoi]|nr:hypothetical protein C8J57DRAFT_1525039 [Mycena rebaudengoi]
MSRRRPTTRVPTRSACRAPNAPAWGRTWSSDSFHSPRNKSSIDTPANTPRMSLAHCTNASTDFVATAPEMRTPCTFLPTRTGCRTAYTPPPERTFLSYLSRSPRNKWFIIMPSTRPPTRLAIAPGNKYPQYAPDVRTNGVSDFPVFPQPAKLGSPTRPGRSSSSQSQKQEYPVHSCQHTPAVPPPSKPCLVLPENAPDILPHTSRLSHLSNTGSGTDFLVPTIL